MPDGAGAQDRPLREVSFPNAPHPSARALPPPGPTLLPDWTDASLKHALGFFTKHHATAAEKVKALHAAKGVSVHTRSQVKRLNALATSIILQVENGRPNTRDLARYTQGVSELDKAVCEGLALMDPETFESRLLFVRADSAAKHLTQLLEGL